VFELYTTALSANGRKVLALCHQLDLAPVIHEVNVYRGDGQRPEYLAVHPLGKIPTLVDDDITLWESNAILEYVCEAYGDFRLYSREPAGRADIARWLFWESAHWQPALTPVLTPFVAHRLLPDAAPAPREDPDWGDTHLSPLLRLVDAHLAERAFLTGDELTIADLSVAGMTTYLPAAGFPFDAFPGLGAWHERIADLEAWRATAVDLWAP
jgi:glutathione S-transferase